MYDNGDMKVTVTTSEISREEEDFTNEERTWAAVPRLTEASAKDKSSIPMSKSTSFKKVAKHKSRGKPRNKRDKTKGRKNKKKSR